MSPEIGPCRGRRQPSPGLREAASRRACYIGNRQAPPLARHARLDLGDRDGFLPTWIRLGRSAAARRAADRRRAPGPGQCARVRPGAPHDAGPESQPPRAFRPRDPERDGRARHAGRDAAPALRLRRGLPRRLRADRPGGRARRLGLPLGHERAVLARHAPDPRLRNRSRSASAGSPASRRASSSAASG